jgi:hypothetical protein
VSRRQLVRVISIVIRGALVLAAGCRTVEPEEPESEWEEEASETEEPAGAEADSSVVSFVGYRRDPVQHVGVLLDVRATVLDVVSDRVVWLRTAGGERVLAVLREDPNMRGRLVFAVGDQIQFDAAVMPRTAAGDLAMPLDAGARRAIRSTPTFLAIYASDVRVFRQPRRPPPQ